MSGLFNSFYYGKAGKADFTPDQLPKNRVQLFLEMLRIRFAGIITMNLVYVLFSLPAIIWSYINILVLSGSQEYNEAGELIASTTLSMAEANSYLMVYLVGMIPCLMVASLGLVGIYYVLRNWARDQHSFVWSDLKDAIKGNWKGALGVGFINGLSLLITFFCYRYYGMMSMENAFWSVPQMLVVMLCALWWMANMLILPMMITYDMPFKTLVRNSFVIIIARLPFSILVWAPTLAIPVILALFVPYGYLIAILLYLLIGFGITFFVYVSYANACFDRFLNPRIEGAQVNMGLRDPSLIDEDDDEEPVDPEKELRQ